MILTQHEKCKTNSDGENVKSQGILKYIKKIHASNKNSYIV